MKRFRLSMTVSCRTSVFSVAASKKLLAAPPAKNLLFGASESMVVEGNLGGLFFIYVWECLAGNICQPMKALRNDRSAVTTDMAMKAAMIAVERMASTSGLAGAMGSP